MARYKINNAEYPSVTEILGILEKPALVQWAANCTVQYIKEHLIDDQTDFDDLLNSSRMNFRDISQTAKDIGSEVHDVIEKYIKYGKDKIGETSKEVTNALIAFWDWEKENKVEWIESEQSVINESIGYAGKFDAIAKINGVTTCIDFKSSKAIYDEYITQVIAYKFARESMNGEYTFNDELKQVSPIIIEAVAILKLDKETGLPEFKNITDINKIQKQYKAFCYLCQYWYHAKNRKLKNNPLIEIMKIDDIDEKGNPIQEGAK